MSDTKENISHKDATQGLCDMSAPGKPSFPPRIRVDDCVYVGNDSGYWELFDKTNILSEHDPEYLSSQEHEHLLTQARAEGERIGSIKERLKMFQFQASDPGEHHALRANAQEQSKHLLVELMRLGQAARKDAKRGGEDV